MVVGKNSIYLLTRREKVRYFQVNGRKFDAAECRLQIFHNSTSFYVVKTFTGESIDGGILGNMAGLIFSVFTAVTMGNILEAIIIDTRQQTYELIYR